ncbi:MAG: DUF2780 domain-containing protein [Planctomycetaceae bacterium]
MDIVSFVASQLGIDEKQAAGGIGMIFSAAKEKLESGDFSQLADAVPGIQGLMDDAPSPEEEGGGGLLGTLGGLASKFGLEDLGKLANLAAGFKKLGLDASMITKFLPKILEWLQSSGGSAVKAILEKALK